LWKNEYGNAVGGEDYGQKTNWWITPTAGEDVLLHVIT
jgi:hypothetical protein